MKTVHKQKFVKVNAAVDCGVSETESGLYRAEIAVKKEAISATIKTMKRLIIQARF